jgi:hypothetical protein
MALPVLSKFIRSSINYREMAQYLLTLRALKFWANGVRRGRSRRISPDFSSSLRLLQIRVVTVFFLIVDIL